MIATVVYVVVVVMLGIVVILAWRKNMQDKHADTARFSLVPKKGKTQQLDARKVYICPACYQEHDKAEKN